ncbi:MAG: hypothetical protein WCI97_06755, partial [Bacteroidota bacterium]
TVTVFPLPTATASNDGASICLGGTLHLTSTGGIYFNWTGPNGFNSTLQNPIIPNVTNVNGGLYTVTVASANGCAGSANTTVVLPTPIIPTVNHTDVTTFGGSDGTATASAIGGVGPPYSFNWSNGAVSAAINSLSIGVYYVTITNNIGCTTVSSTVITQPAQQSLASDYFRAKNSGGWSSEEVWESSHDEINWFDATLTPNDQANTILIGNGKTIEISAETVTADQLVIEASASLSIINEGSLQLLNGAIEADDMVCDGVLGIIGAGLGGGGTVGMNGSSTLNVQSAFLENITINVLSGCTFNMLSSDIHFDSNLTINNYTTCDYEGGNLWFSNTSPTFNNYGTFHFFDNNSLFVFDNASGEAFNNMVGGNVIIDEGFTLNTDLVTFNNYGSVDIQNGTLNINNASGINSGNYTLNSETTFTGEIGLSFTGTTITNNGQINFIGLNFNGSGYQEIAGIGSINSLTINNPNGINLLGNQTITGNLDLVGGRIITGENKLITNNGATISNASGFGFIEGNLERYISVPGDVEYPVGDNANTAFVTLGPSFTGAGYVEVRTDAGDHPDIANSGIDADKSLNRTWTFTNNGLVFTECDVTFNWALIDLDEGADYNNFILAKYDNPNWTLPSSTSVINSTSLYVDNLTSFSQFQIGEHPCVVSIPDSIFKTYLLNSSVNTNSDSEIQCSEAASFTGGFNVVGLGISDLTGVEAFTSIYTLGCGDNLLTSLDVSANTALTQLYCFSNQLTTLDLSANTLLTELYAGFNQITSLDLSHNTALTKLLIYDNQLTSLDVAANPALTQLYCYNNQLTSLDVSANPALTILGCNFNNLTSLDVSANPALTQLYCYNNTLTSLNIQNGNNFNLANFNCLNNFELSCIQVDDPGYMDSIWSSYKDTGATFSLNCGCAQPDMPNLSSSTICFNGSAILSVTSGNLNDATDWYWYTGGCGGTFVGNGTSIIVAPEATETYYVRGEGGCTIAGSCSTTTVTVTPSISLLTLASNVTCNGGANGSIDLTVTGGTPSYSYFWSNTASNEDLNSLSPGFYQVTVFDAAGCNSVDSVVITEPIAIALTANDTIFCLDNGSHIFKLIASGGALPYYFTGDDTVNTSAGIHTFTVTDNSGCVVTTNATVDTVSGCILAGTGSWLGKIDSIIGPALFYLSVIDTLPIDTFQQIIASVNADSIVYKFNFDTTKVLIDVIVKAIPGNLNVVKAFLMTPPYGMTYMFDNGDTTLTITGYYPIGNLLLLNSRKDKINFVRTNNRPLSSSGLIYSQGDHAMKGDSARMLFGLDGSGIKVGVLSDSYNTQPGDPAAIDLSNKDLPGLTNP